MQEMVRDVVLGGVVFTHELNTGAPYYVVNYDDTSGLTNTVTSGAGEYANRTSTSIRVRLPSYALSDSSSYSLRSPSWSRSLVVLFDIEFALDKDCDLSPPVSCHHHPS